MLSAGSPPPQNARCASETHLRPESRLAGSLGPGQPTAYAVIEGERWPKARIRAAIAVSDLAIAGTFRRLELAGICWVDVMRRGIFGNGWGWET